MRWKFLRLRIGITPIALLLAVALNASAQSTASIEGQVVDQNGAVIAGVTIIATNNAIAVERVATSDESGRYQLPALPVGNYTVAARTTGFKQTIVANLSLEVGRRVTQDFQLEVGEVSEQVAVSSANTGIDRSSVSVG